MPFHERCLLAIPYGETKEPATLAGSFSLTEREGFEPSIGLYNPITV
jgi:hypothetical protein